MENQLALVEQSNLFIDICKNDAYMILGCILFSVTYIGIFSRRGEREHETSEEDWQNSFDARLEENTKEVMALQQQLKTSKRAISTMQQYNLENIIIDIAGLKNEVTIIDSKVQENIRDIAAVGQQLKTTKRAISTMQEYNIENIVIDVVSMKKQISDLTKKTTH
eukprot:762836-Hanusia_phi.AAC.5